MRYDLPSRQCRRTGLAERKQQHWLQPSRQPKYLLRWLKRFGSQWPLQMEWNLEIKRGKGRKRWGTRMGSVVAGYSVFKSARVEWDGTPCDTSSNKLIPSPTFFSWSDQSNHACNWLDRNTIFRHKLQLVIWEQRGLIPLDPNRPSHYPTHHVSPPQLKLLPWTDFPLSEFLSLTEWDFHWTISIVTICGSVEQKFP